MNIELLQNLSAPALVEALWLAHDEEQRTNGYLKKLCAGDFRAIMLPLATAHAGSLINRKQDAAAHAAAAQIILGFRDAIGGIVPAGWLEVFRPAFDAQLISASTWGAIVRLIYTGHGPALGYRGERHADFLDAMRRADPRGLMLPDERRVWASLPATVTAYRGALAHTVEAAAQGISWSLRRDYSELHLFRRDTHAQIPRLLAQAAFGRSDVACVSEAPKRLIMARIPKCAVLAYIGAGDDEIFVDYECIDPAAVIGLGTNNLLLNGVAAKVAGIRGVLMGVGV